VFLKGRIAEGRKVGKSSPGNEITSFLGTETDKLLLHMICGQRRDRFATDHRKKVVNR